MTYVDLTARFVAWGGGVPEITPREVALKSESTRYTGVV